MPNLFASASDIQPSASQPESMPSVAWLFSQRNENFCIDLVGMRFTFGDSFLLEFAAKLLSGNSGFDVSQLSSELKLSG